MQAHKILAGLLVTALALGGAGCGSDGTTAADNPAGNGTEQATDKTNAVGSEQNGESDIAQDDSTAESVASVDLPDDWPDLLAIPDGFTVFDTDSMVIDGLDRRTVYAKGPGEIAAVTDAFRDRLEAAGYEISQESYSEGGARFDADNATETVEVAVMSSTGGNVKIQLGVYPKSDNAD